MKLTWTTALSLLMVLVLIASNSSAAPSIADSDDNVAQQVSYRNRVILIRHAEKGFTPADPVADSGPSTPSPCPDDRRKEATGHRYSGSNEERSWWSWLRHALLSSACEFAWPGRNSPREPLHNGERREHVQPGWPGRGRFPNGLSEKGKERAQYIRITSETSPEFEIGMIFAAPRDGEGDKEAERTYATVNPLAKDLNLVINISCANTLPSCILDHIEEFAKTSNADILISWKHRDLSTIATTLGASNAYRGYPDDRNDLVWIMSNGRIVEKRSMHCPGLDDDRVIKGDPDLEVDQPREIPYLIRWLCWWTSLSLL